MFKKILKTAGSVSLIKESYIYKQTIRRDSQVFSTPKIDQYSKSTIYYAPKTSVLQSQRTYKHEISKPR